MCAKICNNILILSMDEFVFISDKLTNSLDSLAPLSFLVSQLVVLVQSHGLDQPGFQHQQVAVVSDTSSDKPFQQQTDAVEEELHGAATETDVVETKARGKIEKEYWKDIHQMTRFRLKVDVTTCLPDM